MFAPIYDRREHVSILVVLELGRSSRRMFNRYLWFVMFQSLLFWNLVDHKAEAEAIAIAEMFQSLLFWNLVDHSSIGCV